MMFPICAHGPQCCSPSPVVCNCAGTVYRTDCASQGCPICLEANEQTLRTIAWAYCMSLDKVVARPQTAVEVHDAICNALLEPERTSVEVEIEQDFQMNHMLRIKALGVDFLL